MPPLQNNRPVPKSLKMIPKDNVSGPLPARNVWRVLMVSSYLCFFTSYEIHGYIYSLYSGLSRGDARRERQQSIHRAGIVTPHALTPLLFATLRLISGRSRSTLGSATFPRTR